MNKVLLFLSALLCLTSTAQLTVNNGSTAQQLGNNLAGSNVTVTNATITGDPNQYGTFQYTGTDLGLNSGVILSTGNIFDAVGPNSQGGTSTGYNGPGDPDLTNLAGFNTNDAVVFEFDFEVQGDEIEFNFVFMSEEYNEFVNSGFNDVFAFYISGPGIVGQENLAVVPGTTTPVTINTINNGSFWQFFNDNTAGGVNIEFDGFTTLMTAKRDSLTPCGIYTLSLRIADGSDDILDSGVLLEENSLVQSSISASSSTFSANNTALEGCIDASFTFQLDSILSTDVNIPIGIGGTATNGVDYAQIDTIITIPAGQLSATIIIDAIADGITEGQEVVELYFSPSPCEPQDTVFLYIDDYQPIEFTTTPADLSCFQSGDGEVDFNITGGIAPYTVMLTDSATGVTTSYTSFPITGLDAGTYMIEIIDGYGCAAEDVVSGSLFDAGQTFIPDGQGQSYTSSIPISGFGAGQTLTSVNQFTSICATMEHSRIGELEILLEAPNGTQLVLKAQPGGAVTNMGEPCAIGPADAGNTDTLPGIGYNYCWTPTPTYLTMSQEANNYTYQYTTVCYGTLESDKYLPAGSYTPADPISNLIGVPLNGNWSIIVTDNIPNNNGYIFDWSLSLNADLPDSIVTLVEPGLPTFSSVETLPTCGVNDGAIDITVIGDNPPFTYLWNTGATTEDIASIPAGSYSVDVTDANNCTYTYTVSLPNNGTLSVTGVTTDESCVGASDGAIDITTTGGTAPFTYDWSNGVTTEDVSGLAPGNYSVEVTDATGCLGVVNFSINAAANLIITGAVANEVCGDHEGSVDLSVQGGVGPYSYLWSNGDTTQDLLEEVQGTYWVNVTDTNGCVASDTFDIINLVGNCVPSCDLEITDSIIVNEACGDGAGLIDITVYTTNGPAAYSWSTGSTIQDINSLSAGSYTVDVTDAEGCNVSQTFNITNVTGGLTISSINTTNEYCGNSGGALDATISGGAQPYAFTWSNGGTTEDISGLSAGSYTLTVTDANGCSASQSASIVNDAGTLVQTYGNAVDEVCSQSNGSIDIIIQGGQQPYSYSWTNGATTEDLMNIPAGSYTCTITDAGGCSITTPTYIVNNDPGNLAFTYIDVDNEVCGNGLGNIELFYTGGTAPFTYSWNNGQTTQDIFNLSAGTYVGTITDSAGCSLSTGNLNLQNESGSLSLDNIIAFDEVCGNGTGSVNLTVSGGTQPVSFLWNNGSTSEDLSNLSAGNYDCVVTDSNGCQVFAGISVYNDPGALSIDNMISSNETCGQGNGSIDLVISGQNAPASFSWNSGQTTEDISGLSAGNYTVTVTDNIGCQASSSTSIINDAGSLTLDGSIVVNEVCGNAAGSIELSVSGGVAPLSFAWSSGDNTEDISNLSAGTYTCIITDNTGCSITAGPYTINNASGGLVASITSTTDETCGDGSGSIDVTVSGGAAPYIYSWSNGPSTEDISNLSAGSYTITVTDNTGCTTSSTSSVSNSSGTLTISGISVIDELCGNGNGAIDITAAGGTAPYTFSWSHGPTTEDATGLAAGLYTVTVTDDSGCSIASTSITVNNSSGTLVLTNVSVTDEICSDGGGAIDVGISGGTAPFTYAWNTGQTTEDIAGLSAGSYTCTITDANGCELNLSTSVGNDPGTLAVGGAIITDATCGNTNGSIDLTISGGTAPYGFVWSQGSTTEDITGLVDASYVCNISDAAGCSLNYTASVADIGGNLGFSNINVTDEQCGSNDGSITVTPSGGTAPYTYTWSGPITSCCTYTLDMQDQGNSWNGASVDVYLDGTFEGSYTVFGGGANVETFSVCDGQVIDLLWNQGGFDNEISFDLLDASGTPIFSQGGSPTPGIIFTDTASCPSNPPTSNTATNLTAGSYSVTVTDANGCSYTQNVTIGSGAGTLSVSNAIVTDETCSQQDGAIDITVNGQNPINISWSTGATTEDISGLSAGTYTVTLDDVNGCSVIESYTVVNNNGVTFDPEVIVDEFCGDGAGSIDITIAGGIAPFTFNWSNGATTEDISGLSAGSYSVTVTDATGCSQTMSYVVSNNTTNGFAASSTSTDENCGASDGSIDVTVTGGVAPYTYSWSSGDTTEDLIGISGGIYTCTITDNTGCTIIITDTVTNITGGLTVTGVSNDATCGVGNGSIDITVNGGTAPYTYVWSNGATTEDVNLLNPGFYSCDVTDATGCTVTHTDTITDQSVSITGAVIVDELCSDSSGSIDVNATGGVSPYNYSWTSTVPCCEYTLNMYDLNNNGWGGNPTPYVNVYINGALFGQFTVPVGNGNSQQVEMIPVCMGDSIALEYEAGGFNANNTYDLINPLGDTVFSDGPDPLNGMAYADEVTICPFNASTNPLSNLTAGSYTVTITDQNGCTDTTTYVIENNPGSLAVTDTIITDDNCATGVGGIDITVSGGSGAYTFDWSTGATMEDVTALNAGSYSVEVSDGTGCILNQTYSVANTTTGLVVSDTIISDEACGDGLGAIDLTVSGGVTPYTYAWSTGDASEDVDSLSAGTYSVTITDGSGCATTETYSVVNNLNGLAASTVATNGICGAADGAIDLTVNGGSSPYSYLWSNGATTEDITGLATGTYSVDITDASGCTISAVDSVQSLDFSIDSTSVSDEQCGNSDGSIEVFVSGGTGPYSYDWGSSNPCCSYTLNMYDLNNNGWGGNPEPYVIVYINGTQYGQFGIPVGNGNSQATETIPVCAGDTIAVEYVEAAQNQNNTYELLDAQGNIIFSDGPDPLAGGIAFSAAVTNCVFQSNQNPLSGLGAGTYSVTVTDANGCTDTAGATVNNIVTSMITGVTITNATCATCGDGAIDISTNPGNAPYTFNWPDIPATTEDVNGLNPGYYDVSITGADGCTLDTTILVGNDDPDGVIELSMISTTIFPNPSNGKYMVTYQLGGDSDIIIEIYNPIGQIVENFEIDNPTKTGSFELDLETYSAGTYLMRIRTTHGESVQRLMLNNH